MTEFIAPSILGMAALGVGVGLSVSPPTKEPEPVPSFVRISYPIGAPASDGLMIAHPVIAAVEPKRVVRVVLSSPFVRR